MTPTPAELPELPEPAYPDCYEVPRTGGATRSGFSYDQMRTVQREAFEAGCRAALSASGAVQGEALTIVREGFVAALGLALEAMRDVDDGEEGADAVHRWAQWLLPIVSAWDVGVDAPASEFIVPKIDAAIAAFTSKGTKSPSPGASPTECTACGADPIPGDCGTCQPLTDEQIGARWRLHRFLDVAAGEGLELAGVDAADLFNELFEKGAVAALAAHPQAGSEAAEPAVIVQHGPIHETTWDSQGWRSRAIYPERAGVPEAGSWCRLSRRKRW